MFSYFDVAFQLNYNFQKLLFKKHIMGLQNYAC